MTTLRELGFLTEFSQLSGRDYEDATADLVRVLADQQDIETLELSTRVLLRGASTTHELDVWWRFVWDDQEMQMAFQCKKRGRPIDQGEVLKFLSVLQDLGNGTHGMMVTHLGYQRGALAVARHYDIGALELRRPLEKDWAGRFRDFEMHIELVSGRFQDLQICDVRGRRLTHVRDHPLYHVGDFADEFHVIKPNGQRESLARLLASQGPPLEEISAPIKLSVDCPPGTQLFAPNDEVPVEIKKVAATMHVARPRSSFSQKGDDVVRLILRDAIGGDLVRFDSAGKPMDEVRFPFPEG